MKLRYITTILVLLSLNSFSQKRESSLDLEGTVTADRSRLQGAVVSVMRDGKYFTSFVTANDGEYNLYLPLGSEYVITVTKQDFIKKVYTVNTTGVPAESVAKPFPVIEADLDLFKKYEGIDYSLFDQPMNKYFYNERKDNFDYDREYLKMMQALVVDFRKNEKNLIAQKKLEAEKRKLDELLASQQKEREMYDSEALKKMEDEQKLAAAQKSEKAFNVTEDIVVTASAPASTGVKKNTDQKIAAILLQYKPGVTEEVIEAKGVIIIKRVVVRDEMAWIYLKKIFSWGDTAFFRDGMPITEMIFEQETKKGS